VLMCYFWYHKGGLGGWRVGRCGSPGRAREEGQEGGGGAASARRAGDYKALLLGGIRRGKGKGG